MSSLLQLRRVPVAATASQRSSLVVTRVPTYASRSRRTRMVRTVFTKPARLVVQNATPGDCKDPSFRIQIHPLSHCFSDDAVENHFRVERFKQEVCMCSIRGSTLKVPMGIVRVCPVFVLVVALDAVAAKWVGKQADQIDWVPSVSTALVMVFCLLPSLINHMLRQWRDLHMAHIMCSWLNLGALLLCMIIVLLIPSPTRIVNFAIFCTFGIYPLYHHMLCFVPRARASNLVVLSVAAVFWPQIIHTASRPYQTALFMALMLAGELVGSAFDIRVRHRYLRKCSSRVSDEGDLATTEPLLASEEQHHKCPNVPRSSLPGSPSMQGGSMMTLNEMSSQLIDSVTQTVVCARQLSREVSAHNRDAMDSRQCAHATVALCSMCDASPAARTLLPCACARVCHECSAQLFRYDRPYLPLERVGPQCPHCSATVVASMTIDKVSRTLVLSIKLPAGARIVIE